MDEIETLKAQVAQLEKDLAAAQEAHVAAEEAWKVEIDALRTRNKLHDELMAILDSPTPLQQAHLDQIAASHVARPMIRILDMRAKEAQRVALLAEVAARAETEAALRAEVDRLDRALDEAERAAAQVARGL